MTAFEVFIGTIILALAVVGAVAILNKIFVV